mmetsp:Transcript_9605/g.14535  ORF Transcript_9605/g.14535 Transcript_9605/m.14535 type:complete len:210 (+) Transcript_9605:317-946(+)
MARVGRDHLRHRFRRHSPLTSDSIRGLDECVQPHRRPLRGPQSRRDHATDRNGLPLLRRHRRLCLRSRDRSGLFLGPHRLPPEPSLAQRVPPLRPPAGGGVVRHGRPRRPRGQRRRRGALGAGRDGAQVRRLPPVRRPGGRRDWNRPRPRLEARPECARVGADPGGCGVPDDAFAVEGGEGRVGGVRGGGRGGAGGHRERADRTLAQRD